MKKYLCILLFIAIIMGTAACGTEEEAIPLSIPDFPLDEITVAAALQESVLPWTAVELGIDWLPEGQTTIGLYAAGTERTADDFSDDEDNILFIVDEYGVVKTIVADITSSTADGERALVFNVFNHATAPLPTLPLPDEMWESVITLVTRLFGGFESEYRLYSAFREEFGTVNTTVQARPPEDRLSVFDERVIWRSVVNEVHVLAIVGRISRTQAEYLDRLWIVSDLYAFGFDKWWDS